MICLPSPIVLKYRLKVQERTFGKPCILLEHRRPKLYGSSLDFEFIRKCMKINKIRPKFHFLAKIEIQMTHLVFFFFFYCLFASRAVPCQNLILNVDKTKQNKNTRWVIFISIFVQKWNLGCILFIFKHSLINSSPTNSHRVWAAGV